MIRTSDDYILRSFHGTDYLIPIGQKIALGRPCLELNESGVLLWNAVKSGVPEHQLEDMLRKRFPTDSTAEADIAGDAGAFISRLIQVGALTDDRNLPTPPCRYFRIAGLSIAFTGHTPCLHDSLSAFAGDACDEILQRWILRPLIFMPAFSGEIIINNRQLTLFLCEEYYILMFPENKHLLMSRISKDGSAAEFYYDHLVTDDARTELFYGMRNAFLIMAQNNGLFALHSASVDYGGMAWLFSGKSGMGKSTHTALWNSLYHVEIINGDINLIGMEDGEPMVYGTPWCGTSGIFSPKTYRLGGVVLLVQSARNEVQELSEGLRQLLLFQRLISPTWFAWQVDKNLEFADRLQQQVKVCRLLCTPLPEAVQVMKSYIDSLPENHNC
ncbi:MAG: PqqD family protein [Lachnospiraceae bacterium]|nr:PqqD family protein [Lachnospiraceae bacterium]MCM1240073.1 PqqD family protein [Lachnospiraceae bacterium]